LSRHRGKMGKGAEPSDDHEQADQRHGRLDVAEHPKTGNTLESW